MVFSLVGGATIEVPRAAPTVKLQLMLDDTAFDQVAAGGSATADYTVIAPSGITYTLDSFEPEGWEVTISEPKENKGTVTVTLPQTAAPGKVLFVLNGSDGSSFTKVVRIGVIANSTETTDSGSGTMDLPAGATDVTVDADWVTFENGQLVFAENTGYDARTAVVTYKDANGVMHTVTIVQAQKDAIVLTAPTVEASPEGETVLYYIKTNVEVAVSSDVDWITLQPATKGLEEIPFSFMVAANATGKTRTGHVVFTAGKLSQSVEVSQESQAVEPGSDDYVLVTDASELMAGDKLLIVNKEGTYVMAGQVSSGNRYYRSRTAVTVSAGIISEVPSAAAVVTLEGEEGAWNLAVEGGYLSALATGNYLKTAEAVDNYATWTISVTSEGLATLLSKSGESSQLSHNGASNAQRFSCYKTTSSSAGPVCLYRLPGVPPEPVTQYDALGLYLGPKVRTYTRGTDQYIRSYEGNSLSFVLVEPDAKEQLVISGIDTAAQQGQEMTLGVEWKKGTQSMASGQYNMTLLKDEGGKLWIGDNKGRGFIIMK